MPNPSVRTCQHTAKQCRPFCTTFFNLFRLEGSPKKGDADGSDGEDQPEVVLQEPEDEEDNDDYAKSYFDPGDDDEDDGDDVDKED